jgi:hypothetical protein
MKYTTAVLFAAALLAAGCNDNKTTKVAQTTPTATPAAATTTTGAAKSEEDQIKENLAKLSPEDRALAEKQKYCVNQPDERLGGEMGVPIKLMIKGEPVFICCGGCKKDVLKDPDKALAKAKELREKNAKK